MASRHRCGRRLFAGTVCAPRLRPVAHTLETNRDETADGHVPHPPKRQQQPALLIDYGGRADGLNGPRPFRQRCASIGVNSSGFLNESVSAASQAEDSPFPLLELGRSAQKSFSERLTPVLRRHTSVPVDGHQFYAAVAERDLGPGRGNDSGGQRFYFCRGAHGTGEQFSWGSIRKTYPWDLLPAFTRGRGVHRTSGCASPTATSTCWPRIGIGVEPAECVFVDDLEVNWHRPGNWA